MKQVTVYLGGIAKDIVANLRQFEKLNENNHDRYFREMQANNLIEIPTPMVKISLEAVADVLDAHFWTELYKPNREVKNLRPFQGF